MQVIVVQNTPPAGETDLAKALAAIARRARHQGRSDLVLRLDRLLEHSAETLPAELSKLLAEIKPEHL